MVNHSQYTTSELWKKNCRIIYGPRSIDYGLSPLRMGFDDARNVNLKDRPNWSCPRLILILRQVNE